MRASESCTSFSEVRVPASNAAFRSAIVAASRSIFRGAAKATAAASSDAIKYRHPCFVIALLHLVRPICAPASAIYYFSRDSRGFMRLLGMFQDAVRPAAVRGDTPRRHLAQESARAFRKGVSSAPAHPPPGLPYIRHQHAREQEIHSTHEFEKSIAGYRRDEPAPELIGIFRR